MRRSPYRAHRSAQGPFCRQGGLVHRGRHRPACCEPLPAASVRASAKDARAPHRKHGLATIAHGRGQRQCLAASASTIIQHSARRARRPQKEQPVANPDPAPQTSRREMPARPAHWGGGQAPRSAECAMPAPAATAGQLQPSPARPESFRRCFQAVDTKVHRRARGEAPCLRYPAFTEQLFQRGNAPFRRVGLNMGGRGCKVAALPGARRAASSPSGANLSP